MRLCKVAKTAYIVHIGVGRICVWSICRIWSIRSGPLFGGGREWLVLQIHEFHHGPPLWSLFFLFFFFFSSRFFPRQTFPSWDFSPLLSLRARADRRFVLFVLFLLSFFLSCRFIIRICERSLTLGLPPPTASLFRWDP